MKPRKHQYLDICITLLFAGTCIQSALRGSNALDLLSTLSMYTIMSSIFIGLLVTAYVHLKKDQIFDPLSSELNEEWDGRSNLLDRLKSGKIGRPQQSVHQSHTIIESHWYHQDEHH